MKDKVEKSRADKQKKKEDEAKEKSRKGKDKHEDKEQLTEKDKKKHKQYVADIIQKLKADKGNNAKTFKEFHASKVKLAKDLEGRYQKKLKKGINIDITILPLERDKKDNDVDVKIKIAPNNAEEEIDLKFRQQHQHSGSFQLAPGTFSKQEANGFGKIYNSKGEEKEIHLIAKHGPNVIEGDLRSRLDDVYQQFSDFREKLINGPKGLQAKIDNDIKGINTFNKKIEKFNDPQKIQEFEEKVDWLENLNNDREARISYLESIGEADRDLMKQVCEEERYSKIAFTSTKFESDDVMYDSILEALKVNKDEIDNSLTDSRTGESKPEGTLTRKPIKHSFTNNIGVGFECDNQMNIVPISRDLKKVAITLIVSNTENKHYKVYTAYPDAT